ncbi:hypothetical protein KW842_26845 [Duganella sp. sic0402]|uniref:DUF7281 domain-containing protein n=1 Tax=Duganella sp. sic0402 TaxID=2854786 RepID=UPI001C449D82|nr:hypothetical protein [Duganella sp. sic0402]MBV7539395.1 hypothetical protein [Duganella sp. sic0402]
MMTTKMLAQSLLKVVQSPPERVQFRASKTLTVFVAESGIGTLQGKNVTFNAAHKVRICDWLRADKIDPTTPANAWADVSRAAALELGPDEKWAGLAVRANRIMLKALPGRPLICGGESIFLPPRANLEFDVLDALECVRHDSVIVVENWEVFERINNLELDLQPAGDNPLILWRGGAHVSIGAAISFLDAFERAVWSAPDYDPEGLAIASRLPHLKGVLAPPDEVLRSLLKKSKLQGRYISQLAGSQAVLEHAQHPDVRRLWSIVKESRNALPQERFCSVGN